MEQRPASKAQSRRKNGRGVAWSSAGLVAVAVLVVGIATPAFAVRAQPLAPASYSTSIHQGIAYVLMLVALMVTYLIHPLDATSPYKF